MVRSNSVETNSSDSHIHSSCNVVNEFYGLKCLGKKITPATFNKNFIKLIRIYLMCSKKLRINATEPKKNEIVVMLGYIQLEFARISKTTNARALISSFSTFLAHEKCSLLYYLVCRVIFSHSIKSLSKSLLMRCCGSPSHYRFCTQKWKELESYCIYTLPILYGFSPTSSYRPSEITSAVFSN